MSDTTVRRKLLGLMLGRVVIATVLLGSAILVQVTSPGSFRSSHFFGLIVVTYALTVFYAMTLRLAERHRWLVDLQLGGDALIVSAFIYVTGGIASYFSSLYVLPIIAASTLQYRRGALMVAVLSTVIYVGLVVGQYMGAQGFLYESWITEQPIVLPAERLAEYTVAINVFGFFAVAILSGSLAESVRSADVRLARASNEIANLQAFNQHVIDSLTMGLVTTDYGGRILTFSRAAEAITNQPASSVAGHNVNDVLQLPPEFAAGLEVDLERALSRRADFMYRTGDGREIELGLSATHLVTPSGRAGFLFTFQDVTSMKKLERDARMQQRLAALGEMAAGIAHEIRNPLASMSGSIQILRNELPLTEEQEQLMDIVLRESERLNQTIRSFLAYARPQRFAISRVDLRRVLNDAALLLRNSAEVREGHHIEVDVPATEVWCEADEGQIRQIVWNLATNGLRAMATGGRLALMARTAPGGADVVLAVQDEGIGIAEAELDSMFQPFRGSFAKGSGLGMAIVHRIVNDYNGEIQVTSKPNMGTTVEVRLPSRTALTTA